MHKRTERKPRMQGESTTTSPALSEVMAPLMAAMTMRDRGGGRPPPYRVAYGSNLNFWPPTLASNMRPPLPVVKTATPFW